MWQWLTGRAQAKVALVANQAAFQKALSDQAAAFTTSLLEMINLEREEVADLKARIQGLERDNLRCHNENRQLRQMIDSLLRLLRNAGIDVPEGMTVAAILETETDDQAVTGLTAIRAGARHP